jgi:hypothetical protein
MRWLSRIDLVPPLVGLMAASIAFAPSGVCRETAKRIHTVKPGESVARIADYYGVSQNDLRELNNLKKGSPPFREKRQTTTHRGRGESGDGE